MNDNSINYCIYRYRKLIVSNIYIYDSIYTQNCFRHGLNKGHCVCMPTLKGNISHNIVCEIILIFCYKSILLCHQNSRPNF